MSADILALNPATDGLEYVPPRTIVHDPHSTTMQEIQQTLAETGGPIPFSEYMAIVHYGAEGYYSRGKADIRAAHSGDFYTAPVEMTDFCEGIAYAEYKLWVGLGRPAVAHIIEQGAGNGIMAKDTLCFARRHLPDFYDAMRYHIVEYGDMVLKQRVTIHGQNDPKTTPRRGSIAEESTPEEHREDLNKVRWHRGDAITSDLAYDGGIYVVNELADDFPTEVVRRTQHGLEQKFITQHNGELQEVWLPLRREVAEHMARFSVTVEEGKEVAVNLNTAAWQHSINRMLRERSGGMINTDYGFAVPTSQTQAVRAYPYTSNLLYAPGEHNLTSDVDFGMLAQLAHEDGVDVAFAGTQVELLRMCGVPTSDELRDLGPLSGHSDAFFIRARAARAWMRSNCFRGIVLTSGVDVDFTTPAPLRPPYDLYLPQRPTR